MEEKMTWMKNAGIIKLPEPVSYLYQFKGHDAVWLLTEREVAEKPLDELRAMFERDREEARASAETRKGQTMRYLSICAPARMGKHPATFEIIVDTDNDMVELRSEDRQNSIILDLICAAEFDRNFHALVQGVPFQTALGKKVSEYLSRDNAKNVAAV